MENFIAKEYKENPQFYPFITAYWEYHMQAIESDPMNDFIQYNYGSIRTLGYYGFPFYKSISKQFDFNLTLYHDL